MVDAADDELMEMLRGLYLGRVSLSMAEELIPSLPKSQQRHVIVTGGAGFVGSHLVDRLLLQGHHVTVLDDFSTGHRRNIAHWLGHPHFSLIEWDVQEWIDLAPCDQIYHLASPASPPIYQQTPVRTLLTNILGTRTMLELARRRGARFLLASTSEVYGDPEVHPQPEEYHGAVNLVGPRAPYDEGKRAAEALTYAYRREYGVAVRVARIFNTYGPRMDVDDGRVVSNFVRQALRDQPLTVQGTGHQTRSFQYIWDLVEGLLALMESNYEEPINLGNPTEEYEIDTLARIVCETMNVNVPVVHVDGQPDDPHQRRPDISKAERILGWHPKYSLKLGLAETVQYFREALTK